LEQNAMAQLYSKVADDAMVLPGALIVAGGDAILSGEEVFDAPPISNVYWCARWRGCASGGGFHQRPKPGGTS